ncbi:MAG: polymer-forming cytoskeletal protein [Candidatus Aminicenantales bacterium]
MIKLRSRENKDEKEDLNLDAKSHIGDSLHLEGELSGEEDVIIDGQFKGKINLPNNNLIVNKSGKIEADVKVRNISILGEVKGNIFASEKAFIAREGRVEGDIHAPRISITDGAQFKGSVKMNEDHNQQLPLEEIKTPLEKDKNTKSL